tara:strand:- start:1087 stop:1587 length:501 start_codon:yes stop_codon:yes gene_type:complete
MKKLLLIFVLASTPVCHANLSHSISSSVKLTVGGSSTSSSRLGSSYSVSGNGVDTTYTSGGSAVANGVGSLVISSGIGTPPDLTVTQDVPANSFSFSQSFVQADAIPGSAVTTGETPNFSNNVTSIAGGTASSLAGTISSAGAISLTAGGHNTEAVGQVITTLIVD